LRSEREFVVVEDGDGVDGLAEVECCETSGVAGAKTGSSARMRGEPAVGDEDEPLEVGGEGFEKRRRREQSGRDECEAARARREHGQDGASLGPG
jgi:hypothetical protein